MYKIYKENIRKYKTDRKYLSQYNFHNKARSWQLAGNLSPWYNNKNTKKPILAIQPY